VTLKKPTINCLTILLVCLVAVPVFAAVVLVGVVSVRQRSAVQNVAAVRLCGWRCASGRMLGGAVDRVGTGTLTTVHLTAPYRDHILIESILIGMGTGYLGFGILLRDIQLTNFPR
jgi:hypothetical protein